MAMTIEQRVEKLALQLQARGPDEFPYGYYVYLAKVELGVSDDDS